MAEKNENLEKLRKEVEELKVKKEQDEHELIRRNNQIAKLTKTERSRRTSRLCSNAGYRMKNLRKVNLTGLPRSCIMYRGGWLSEQEQSNHMVESAPGNEKMM